jgi:hypothetical protein
VIVDAVTSDEDWRDARTFCSVLPQPMVVLSRAAGVNHEPQMQAVPETNGADIQK